MENDELKDDSWKQLTSSLTWRDVLARYMTATQRVKQYCDAHPGKEMTVEVASLLGGLIAVHRGLHSTIADASQYDLPAEPTMSECVLSLASRIERELQPLPQVPS